MTNSPFKWQSGTSVIGGGQVQTGGFALTVPATGTAALMNYNNAGPFYVASIQADASDNLVVDGYIANPANTTVTGFIRQKYDTNAGYGSYWANVRDAGGTRFWATLGVRISGVDHNALTWDQDGHVGVLGISAYASNAAAVAAGLTHGMLYALSGSSPTQVMVVW